MQAVITVLRLIALIVQFINVQTLINKRSVEQIKIELLTNTKR
ncbi:hypothetical protein GNIT_3713 [Glaciecola nitratireducens FR1064]|uniref:Uncharacterized protein n=1 Tax=Glaciecola nitratireducens (strain JCM 12485 / KCTC 12276 / FR1064) TaxID=1085623 RepID=G4QNK3_GLANF|nr:hypothetical protein GNIT_3713 [Glaciecola nitratireducens FR1064]